MLIRAESFLVMALWRDLSAESEFKRLLPAVFYGNGSLNFADAGWPVRCGIEDNFDCRLFSGLKTFVYLRAKPVSRHAVWPEGSLLGYEEGFGAHARGVNFFDCYRITRRVFNLESMFDFPGRHGNRAEIKHRFSGGEGAIRIRADVREAAAFWSGFRNPYQSSEGKNGKQRDEKGISISNNVIHAVYCV